VRSLRYATNVPYRFLHLLGCGSAEESNPLTYKKYPRRRRTAMAKKNCLYCGLHLPDTTTFCPECGRPIEDATRVESRVKIRSTTITKVCLYCGLHLPDTTTFCPECGRPIERGFEIRPIQESKIDCPHKKLKAKTILHDNKGSIVIAVVGRPRGSPNRHQIKSRPRIP